MDRRTCICTGPLGEQLPRCPIALSTRAADAGHSSESHDPRHSAARCLGEGEREREGDVMAGATATETRDRVVTTAFMSQSRLLGTMCSRGNRAPGVRWGPPSPRGQGGRVLTHHLAGRAILAPLWVWGEAPGRH